MAAGGRSIGVSPSGGGAVPYCQEEGIHFTRGRPYRKNDQAYAEQKIGASVRALVGYGRYSTRAAYAQLQEFYRLRQGLNGPGHLDRMLR
jgi:hypothetical protein